jgi:hypothetical protein
MRLHRELTNVDHQVSLYARLGHLALEHFSSGDDEVLAVRIYHTKSVGAGNTKFRMHIFFRNPHGALIGNIALFGALEFLEFKIDQIEGNGHSKGDPWKYDKISANTSVAECEDEVGSKIQWTIKNQSVTPDYQGDLSRRVAEDLRRLLVAMPIAAHSLSAIIPMIPDGPSAPAGEIPPVIPVRWDEGW